MRNTILLSLLAAAGLAVGAAAQDAPPDAGGETRADIEKRLREVTERMAELRMEAMRLRQSLHEAELREVEATDRQGLLRALEERIGRELAFLEEWSKDLERSAERIDELSRSMRAKTGLEPVPYRCYRGGSHSGEKLDEVYAHLGFERRWPAGDGYESAAAFSFSVFGLGGSVGEFATVWETPRIGYARYEADDPADDVEVATLGFMVAKSLRRVNGRAALYLGGGTGYVHAESVNAGPHEGAYAGLVCGVHLMTEASVDVGLQAKGFFARPGGIDLDSAGLELLVFLKF